MIEFILGLIFAIILIYLGFFFGYYIGTNELDRQIKKIKVIQNRPPSKESGPVKTLTKEEKDKRDNPVRKAIERIVS